MRALLTAALALALAAPAEAQDALRVGLDTEVLNLVAGPDGGAWAGTYSERRQAVHRFAPDGTAGAVADGLWTDGATLGPDGAAWFTSPLRGLARVDAAGTATAFPALQAGTSVAPAPDGSVWATALEPGRLLRVAADGAVTSVALEVPGCDPRGFATHVARAADGALWIHVAGCGFLRRPEGGTAAVVANPRGVTVDGLEPDHTGGMWFTSSVRPGGGHVDAGGRFTPLVGDHTTSDVDVAPDGRAWFATDECALLRAQPDGRVTRVPTAIPTWRLDFAPDGGLWLASSARVRRTTLDAPTAGCDDTPPAVRFAPRLGRRVSLAALRRHRGLELTVREPFALEAWVSERSGRPFTGAVVTAPRGRTVRVPISERRLRRLARLPRPVLRVNVDVRDGEGNVRNVYAQVRVTR